jgi:hypothetical protein
MVIVVEAPDEETAHDEVGMVTISEAPVEIVYCSDGVQAPEAEYSTGHMVGPNWTRFELRSHGRSEVLPT